MAMIILQKKYCKKKNMYIETFITAPHGMIRCIDNQGQIICEADGKVRNIFILKKK